MNVLKDSLDRIKRSVELNRKIYGTDIDCRILDELYFASFPDVPKMCDEEYQSDGKLTLHCSRKGYYFLLNSELSCSSKVDDDFYNLVKKLEAHLLKSTDVLKKSYFDSNMYVGSFKQAVLEENESLARQLSKVLYEIQEHPDFQNTRGARSFIIGQEDFEETVKLRKWTNVTMVP